MPSTRRPRALGGLLLPSVWAHLLKMEGAQAAGLRGRPRLAASCTSRRPHTQCSGTHGHGEARPVLKPWVPRWWRKMTMPGPIQWWCWLHGLACQAHGARVCDSPRVPCQGTPEAPQLAWPVPSAERVLPSSVLGASPPRRFLGDTE